MILGISLKNFVDSLPLMGFGMLGIFIVTGLIVASIYWLNWLFKKK